MIRINSFTDVSRQHHFDSVDLLNHFHVLLSMELEKQAGKSSLPDLNGILSFDQKDHGMTGKNKPARVTNMREAMPHQQVK